MSLGLNLFVVFHNEYYPSIYYISGEDKEYVTMYGVKNRQESEFKTVYEDELAIYNPKLQEIKFNEGSALYHVYANKLHEPHKYIGFAQYDMIMYSHFFTTFQEVTSRNPNTIFYVDRFENGFVGGQTTITTDFPEFPAGLKSYNEYFNTNYTTDDVNNAHLICYNSFIVPTEMYVKLMEWLNRYFIDTLDIYMHAKDGNTFTPGHMIEALTGMFFGLETYQGAEYYRINYSLFHDPTYTLPKTYKC